METFLGSRAGHLPVVRGMDIALVEDGLIARIDTLLLTDCAAAGLPGGGAARLLQAQQPPEVLPRSGQPGVRFRRR